MPDKGGKVIKVKDGDSIVLLEKGNRQTEIRLAHIDAPELHQDFGRKAKTFLSDMVAGEHVTYSIYEEEDRYGRIVAVVLLNDTLNINKEMVKNGYAWHFKRYSNNFQYHMLERNARKDELGLWVDPDPLEPWEYRRK